MLKAVIFDLDGVIVDTAEYHYLAWKRLADELGIPCPPERKDQVRGISRFQALKIVLGGKSVSVEKAKELMARKDAYYQEMIKGISPNDLLPGVSELLDDLKRHKIAVAIATVSRNARTVLSRLGILEKFDALADGHCGARSKPAPDLFLHAAAQLEVPPSECLVIEDAAAGIQGAKAAGMWTMGLGPEERFRVVHPDLIFSSLSGTTYEGLISALKEEFIHREAWSIRETAFDPRKQRQLETLLTVGNGYLGTRGTLEEGYPGDLPATLIAGLYDDAPLVYTELVPAPNWTACQITVAGEPFSLTRGEILFHERTLNLRDGILHRRVRWRSPNGRTIELVSERWASMDNPHLSALRLLITALDFEGEIGLQAEINGVAESPGIIPPTEVGHCHWTWIEEGHPHPQQAFLHLQTKGSKTEIGATAHVTLEWPQEAKYTPCPCLRQPAVTTRFTLQRGETAVITKLVSLYTSHDVLDPVQEALKEINEAAKVEYSSLLSTHQKRWEKLWEDCDVKIEGDEKAQHAVRTNIYHLLIAAPYHTEWTSIPAKALTGFGYRGHIFWDTDVFMLPFFAFTQPEVARNILLYRYHTLPGAREKAQQAGYAGAMYPWESAEKGREVTPRWALSADGTPTRILCGDLEHHITADVAYGLWSYWRATGDEVFMRDYGIEILLETAAFWASRAEYNPSENRYEIRDVMGPDEYHARVDNNAFTNRMAVWNIETALTGLDWLKKRFPEKAAELTKRLGLTEEKIDHFKEVAVRMYVPHDSASGLIEQFPGFFKLRDPDLTAMRTSRKSAQALLGEKEVQRTQIIKQPDVLMLLYLLRDSYNERILRANWDYYEPRTDHDFGSSLGGAIHAALGCEVGETERAYQHFMRAALVDLEDLRGNTGDGIHAASAGGLWQALVFGFAGLRLTPEGPIAYPRLPRHWKRLRFSLRYHGRRFIFDLTPQTQGPVVPTPI